jgi:tetratricopeptide (TPR) repeat protein
MFAQNKHLFMKKIHYLIFILFNFSFFSVVAQDKNVLDSLQQAYKSNIADSTKTLLLAEIANEYRISNTDTAILLAKKSYNLAKNIHFQKGMAFGVARMADAFRRKNNLDSALLCYQEAKILFDKIPATDKGKGIAYNGIASINYSRGEFIVALENFEKALFFRQFTDDKMGISISLNGIGNSYYGIGNYPAALNFYQQSMKMKEEIKDSLGLGISYNNIAQIYYQDKQYDTALVYLQKSMLIKEKMKDKNGMPYSLNNIAGIYFDQQKYELALEYHHKSLRIKEELNDQQGIATSLNNLAQVYASQKKYQIAIQYYIRALGIEKIVKDKQGMIYSLNGLAKIYKDTKKYEESISKGLEALAIAKNIHALSELKDVYETLYQSSKLQGKIANALMYFELHKAISDSLYSGEKTKVLNSLNSSYELSKKQQQIMLLQENKLLQENQLLLKEEEAKEQKMYSIVFAIALMLSGLLAIVLYRNNKQKQKTNLSLEIKNTEIHTQKLEIQETNEELKQINEEFRITLDLLAQQKAEIERKNENITSSINYARRIQNAVLPFEEYMNSSFGADNFFVFYQPRDIVSGDFYWIHNTTNSELDTVLLEEQTTFTHKKTDTNYKDKIVVVVADCTGHGIPGAFMSMIGNELLNQIVNTNEITQPNTILKKLHIGIRHALQQELTANQDGMDVSIVTLTKNKEHSTKDKPKFEKLEYAGAINSLYYFPKNKELIEIKATKKSIGGDRTSNDSVFNLHTLDLLDTQSGDFQPLSFYLFTDGYQDQFGGNNHKKFMSKNFKDLLQANQSKDMPTQHTILQTTLVDWINLGKEQQTDDITVLGVKIN